MKRSPLRAVALAWLCGTLVGCFPRHEPPRPEEDRSDAHRVRILDGADAVIGSLRVRRRSARLSDPRGIPVVKATAVGHRVVVRDREGRIGLVIRPSDRTGTGDADYEARIEDGQARPLGWIRLESNRLVLLGPDGYQRGLVVRRINDDGSEVAEAYGAPGTDLALRVRSDGHRVSIFEPSGTPVAHLEGTLVPPWIAAAMTLQPPDVEAAEGDQSAQLERLYQVGVLVALRRFEALNR